MKAIKYIKLFEYLRDTEELEGIQIFRTMFKVRNLPNNYLLEINNVIEGGSCNLEEEGITYEELVEKDGMKPIRAILFLDWLRTEPEAALAYMDEKAYMRAPIQPLNDDEKVELAAAIERLKDQVKEQPQPVLDIDRSKDDIVIDEQQLKDQTVVEDIDGNCSKDNNSAQRKFLND